MFVRSPALILTGAGASIPVGIPGMRGMAAEYRAYVEENFPQDFKVLQSLQDFGVGLDLEELLQACNEITDLPATAAGKFVERCVSPRGGPEKVRKFRGTQRANIREIEAFRDRLLDWIRRRCLRHDEEKAAALYGLLLSRISRAGWPVFTTNYDPVLDRVAEKQRIRIADNFRETHPGRWFWDPSLILFQQEGLKIIRIHGSTEWYQSPSGEIEKISVPTDVNQKGEPLEGLLIFPTRFKDIYLQPYFPLYSAFSTSLARASLLIIIGHSLRDEYLVAAIRERLRDPSFILVIADTVFPNPGVLNSNLKDYPATVIHLQDSIESSYPNLIQAVDVAEDLSPEATGRLVELLRKTDRDIQQGKKDLIQFAERWKPYFDAGELRSLTLRVRALHASGRIEAWLRRKGGGSPDPNVDREVDLGLRQAEIFGRIQEDFDVGVLIPNELAPKSRHQLQVGIRSPGGKWIPHINHAVQIKTPT